MTTEFSSDEPSAKPGRPQPLDIAHVAKGAGAGDVAAEAFRREVEGERLPADHRAVVVDADLEAGAVGCGRNSAKAEPSSTRTGFSTLMPAPRRALRSDAGPGRSRRRRRWRCRPSPALPAPSISITALSMPRPASAARRCSTVATEAPPGRQARCKARSSRPHASAPESRRPAIAAHRCGETMMPAVGIGGAKSNRHRHAAMNADAGKADALLQRPLPTIPQKSVNAKTCPQGSVTTGSRILRVRPQFCRPPSSFAEKLAGGADAAPINDFYPLLRMIGEVARASATPSPLEGEGGCGAAG